MSYTIFSNVYMDRALVNIYTELCFGMYLLDINIFILLELMSAEKFRWNMLYSVFFSISSFELSNASSIISYITVGIFVFKYNLQGFVMWWMMYHNNHTHSWLASCSLRISKWFEDKVTTVYFSYFHEVTIQL